MLEASRSRSTHAGIIGGGLNKGAIGLGVGYATLLAKVVWIEVFKQGLRGLYVQTLLGIIVIFGEAPERFASGPILTTS